MVGHFGCQLARYQVLQIVETKLAGKIVFAYIADIRQSAISELLLVKLSTPYVHAKIVVWSY